MSAQTAAKASRSKASHHASVAMAEAGPTVAADYRRLCVWRRQHAPWLLYSGGATIFFRLMTAPATQSLRVDDLCSGTTVSSPEVRAVIDDLHRKGLVSISSGSKGEPGEHVEATTLLRRLARCYVQTMNHLL